MDTLTDKINKFLALDVGDGNGNGYGDGNGNGNGNGYGNGYGDGGGNGYGYGYGYGNGNGNGNGNGYGNGYGDGGGDGYGYGDGIVNFAGHTVYKIDNVPTCITQVHGRRYAIGFTIKDNSVKVPCYIARVDNSFAHGETLRDAVNDATAKALQAKPVEERVKEVVKLHPYPTVPISNKELFKLHNTLTGSCEFGRRQFCERHGISLDDSMSMADFIYKTKGEYGGEAIRQLAEAYGIKL